MVVNSCPDDLEGKMTLKRMWKLFPQIRKRERITGGEQWFCILGVSREGGCW